MIIVNFCGGLGNQMFQYATYRKLKELGKEVKADLTFYNKNSCELMNVFGIKLDIATQKDIIKYTDTSRNLISRFRRRVLHISLSKILNQQNHEFVDLNMILKKRNLYLNGYWQSEEYFKDIKNIIKEEFRFKNIYDEKNNVIIQKIKKGNSVSLHVRRGDYLGNPRYENICTKTYYKNAIKYIKEKEKNIELFVFSNDIEWVKNNIKFEDKVNYIDWNKGANNFKDMYLMSKCKHNIIANSSFSWWGAWLNENNNKIIMCPEIWFNDDSLDINLFLPKEWTRIGIN